jgi:hypothetical protein
VWPASQHRLSGPCTPLAGTVTGPVTQPRYTAPLSFPDVRGNPCSSHSRPALDAADRALACNPQVPWAVHAVAHVMETQGRYDEGAAWLCLHQPQWAEGHGFAAHLWWHKALFRSEAMDSAGVLHLVDPH